MPQPPPRTAGRKVRTRKRTKITLRRHWLRCESPLLDAAGPDGSLARPLSHAQDEIQEADLRALPSSVRRG